MAEQKAVQVPSIGRVVHFVLDRGRNAGQHRPAFIVRTWGDDATPAQYVNLQVFTDETNDELPAVLWVTSVQPDHSDTPASRTWHWPEYVPAVKAGA